MTHVTFFKILCTLNTIFGGDWNDWQSKIGDLVEIVGLRIGEPIEPPDNPGIVPGVQGGLLGSNLVRDYVDPCWPARYNSQARAAGEMMPLARSDEENRLNSFWSGYYGAVKRFYGDLDKLDWVAYYQNHGYQIRHDSSGSPQYLPMFPRIEWTCGMPEKYSAGLPSPTSPPFGPGYSPTLLPLSYPPPPWSSGYPSYPYFQRFTPAPTKEMVLNLRLMEAQAAGPKELQSWPNLKIEADGTFEVARGGTLTLRTGTVQDLLAGQTPLPTVPAPPPTFVPAGYGSMNRLSLPPSVNGFSPDEVPIGTAMQGKVTKLADNRVRLDLTLEKSEVENAGKESLLIAAKTYQLAQRLQLGQRTKAILQNDAIGEAKLWLELTVTERAVNPPPEVPYVPNYVPNMSSPGPWPISTPSFPGPAPTPAPRTQVKFHRPVGMMVEGEVSPSPPIQTPASWNFNQGSNYQLWLKNIEGRPGLKVRLAMEIPASNAKTPLSFLIARSISPSPTKNSSISPREILSPRSFTCPIRSSRIWQAAQRTKSCPSVWNPASIRLRRPGGAARCCSSFALRTRRRKGTALDCGAIQRPILAPINRRTRSTGCSTRCPNRLIHWSARCLNGPALFRPFPCLPGCRIALKRS